MLRSDTKRILGNSLEEYMATHTYTAITVQDIVNNCGASRGTFYRHFRDKHDLLRWIIRTHMHETVQALPPAADTTERFRASAQALLDKRSILKQVINDAAQNCFLQFFYDELFVYNYETARQSLGVDKLPPDIHASIKMYTGAVYMIYTDWIRMGFRETPDQIACTLFTNIPELLRPYLT